MREVMVLVVCVAACSKSDPGPPALKKSEDKPAGDAAWREVQVTEFGVGLAAPGDWEIFPVSGGIARIASRMDGIVLQRRTTAPTSAVEAGKQIPDTATLVDAKELPNGGFEVRYQIEGAPEATQVVLPVSGVSVVCDGQQPVHDRAATVKACASMHPLK